MSRMLVGKSALSGVLGSFVSDYLSKACDQAFGAVPLLQRSLEMASGKNISVSVWC